MDDERHFYLPRLEPRFYRADAVAMWTLPVARRAQGWLTPELHQAFRELLLHASAREHLLCPVYCLMPDHIHRVWMGLKPDSDQRNGMAFLRSHLEPHLSPAKFQAQAHDHVLKETERRKGAFASSCAYVRDNPLRAGLVAGAAAWPYTGTIIPGYPKLDLFDETYWEKFWRIYHALRDPKCARQ